MVIIGSAVAALILHTEGVKAVLRHCSELHWPDIKQTHFLISGITLHLVRACMHSQTHIHNHFYTDSCLQLMNFAVFWNDSEVTGMY